MKHTGCCSDANQSKSLLFLSMSYPCGHGRTEGTAFPTDDCLSSLKLDSLHLVHTVNPRCPSSGRDSVDDSRYCPTINRTPFDPVPGHVIPCRQGENRRFPLASKTKRLRDIFVSAGKCDQSREVQPGRERTPTQLFSSANRQFQI